MSKRFTYLAPGLFRSIWLAITSPSDWRERMLPTIIDNETGECILITADEDAMLTVLYDEALRWREKTGQAIDTMFDAVVLAIIGRRNGNPEEWDQFASWQDCDWDGWIRATAQNG